jgi:hypothetical protein
MNDIDAQPAGQFASVADLQCLPAAAARRRAVQHGLAMKTHQFDGFQVESGCSGNTLGSLGMTVGQHGFGATEIRRRAGELPVQRSIHGGLQDRPVLAGIGDGFAGPERRDAYAIGLDQGGIDTVQRGAAHQSDHAFHVRPLFSRRKARPRSALSGERS